MRLGSWLAASVILVAALDVAASWPLLATLPLGARAANLALLTVEALLLAFAALLLLTLRRATLPAPGLMPEGAVDVLVPVRNEAPDVLRATLDAARAMTPPPGGFRLVVVDDSDPARRGGIERVAREAGASFLARPERRGYKAGALNDALSLSRAPFVAVLDVDHAPEPGFLVESLPHLTDGVAYAQGALEWRNADTPLRRLAALLQHQFYHGVQREKGARERAVFAGSGAVFRREALEAVGGFPEETLVEDYDLTMRLCAAGWKGRFTGKVAARGLLPWSVGDLARQLWRWSHGTTEAVALRARELLSSRKAPLAARLELLADGSAYLAGGTLVLAALLLAGLGIAGAPVPRPLHGWALLLAPAALALAHLGNAALALARRGAGGYALLPLYHPVSLAFTPILFVGSLAALVRVGRRHEGRVTKARGAARGLRGALVATLLLGGAALGVAIWGTLPVAGAAWVGLFGVSFVACAVATAGPSVTRE